MKKTISLLLVFILVSSPCFSANYQIVSVEGDKVIFRDTNSRDIFKVGIDEPFDDGWSVILIGKRFVVTEKTIDENHKIRGIIQIPHKGQLSEVTVGGPHK